MNNLERMVFWCVCALFVALIGFDGWCRAELGRIDADLAETRTMVEEHEAWRAEASARWSMTAEAVAAAADAAGAAVTGQEADTPDPALSVTGEERELLARVVYLEARGECDEGKQAVAEVVLNRVNSDVFPDTVAAVVHQPGQFSTADKLDEAAPGGSEYGAVDRAIKGAPAVTEADVVYFSRAPQNDRVYGQIGNHWFCRA